MAWIHTNASLNLEQMQNNAVELLSYFTTSATISDATYNAVAGMLGVLQSESTINPGRWEGGVEYGQPPSNYGYGLAQWTPWTKVSDYYGSTDLDSMPDWLQCELIYVGLTTGSQWFANDFARPVNPPINGVEFLHSDLPPSTLAKYFLWYFEHPSESVLPTREAQDSANAEYWYKYLTGVDPPKPHKPRKSMPIWFYLRPW